MSRTHHRSKRMKVPSKFKKTRRQQRRAKEHQAIKDQKYDQVPVFKKSDQYDYW